MKTEEFLQGGKRKEAVDKYAQNFVYILLIYKKGNFSNCGVYIK